MRLYTYVCVCVCTFAANYRRIPVGLGVVGCGRAPGMTVVEVYVYNAHSLDEPRQPAGSKGRRGKSGRRYDDLRMGKKKKIIAKKKKHTRTRDMTAIRGTR